MSQYDGMIQLPGESEDGGGRKFYGTPPWFEYKLNIGHLITIIALVVGLAVSHGASNSRLEDLEKRSAAQVVANEHQANTNDRLVAELHELGKTMIRLQTQLEDRQDRQEQRQDRQDARQQQSNR